MNFVYDSRAVRALTLCSALLLPLACGSDDKKPPPSSAQGSGGSGATGLGGSSGSSAGQGAAGSARGGQGGGDGAGAPGSDGGGPDDGSGGSATRGGGANTGGAVSTGGSGTGEGGAAPGCPSDDVVEPPDSVSGVCDPAASFGASTAVDIPNFGTQLLSITPDELTLLWLAETSGPQTTYVAERADRDGAFAQAQDLPGRDALALSPDGLRLVTMTPDQSALGLMTRAARGEAFEPSDAAEFAEINADAASRGQSFVAVVIGASDQELYYLLSGDDSESHPLRVSRRKNAGPWPVGEALEDCELAAQGANRRIPTGVSADGLTLFYYDEIARAPRAAYRASLDGPIVWVQTLTDRQAAQPNSACDRLYFSGFSGPEYVEAE